MVKLTERHFSECPETCPACTFECVPTHYTYETYIFNRRIILQLWVGFDQLLANVSILLACWALGVDGYQRRDGLHNLSADSFSDGTCAYGINGSLREGAQGWYLEGEMPIVISSNSGYWDGGIRHTTLGQQFLIVVENSKE